MVALGAMSIADSSGPEPFHGRAAEAQEKIAVYQGQLMLIDAILDVLKGDYKKFLASDS
jgi:hypothetical protein